IVFKGWRFPNCPYVRQRTLYPRDVGSADAARPSRHACDLELPTRPILTAKESIGEIRIRHFQRRGIPFDFLACAIRDISKQYSFSQIASIPEIACCQRAFFAGFDPLLVMADGIWD